MVNLQTRQASASEFDVTFKTIDENTFSTQLLLDLTTSQNNLSLDTNVNSKNEASYTGNLGIHIMCAIVVILVSIVGNGTVLFVYTRPKNRYSCNAYVIALALIDIAACIVLSPFVAFIKTGAGQKLYYYFIAFLFLLICYTSMLTVISLDRVFAVFRPFSYKSIQRRQRTVTMATVAVCLIITLLLVVVLGPVARDVLSGFVFMGSFLILLVAYLAIACRLYKQRKSIVGSKTTSTKNAVKPHPGPRVQEQAASVSMVTSLTSNAAHINKPSTKSGPAASGNHRRVQATVRVFMGITLCFIFSLFSYVFNNLAGFYLPPYLTYLYFINHVANPFIYVLLLEKFRKDVKAIVVNLCPCLK